MNLYFSLRAFLVDATRPWCKLSFPIIVGNRSSSRNEQYATYICRRDRKMRFSKIPLIIGTENIEEGASIRGTQQPSRFFAFAFRGDLIFSRGELLLHLRWRKGRQEYVLLRARGQNGCSAVIFGESNRLRSRPPLLRVRRKLCSPQPR
jgi:hypothetical protein